MKWLDVPVILVPVLIGVFGILYSLSAPTAGSVLIKTPGAEYRYPVGKDRIVTVNGFLGPCVIEIRNGRVRAMEATCSDKICIDRGWVYRSGDSIVCVPNQVIIRLEKGGQTIDAITE